MGESMIFHSDFLHFLYLNGCAVYCERWEHSEYRWKTKNMRPVRIGRSYTGRCTACSKASTTNTIPFIEWHCWHEARHDKMAAHPCQDSGPSAQRARLAVFSQPPRPSTMDTKSSKGQKRPSRESVISTLNVTIEAVNLAKEVSSVTPAKAVFGSVSVILTMIKVRFPPSAAGASKVHAESGINDQRVRLRRPRASLR